MRFDFQRISLHTCSANDQILPFNKLFGITYPIYFGNGKPIISIGM